MLQVNTYIDKAKDYTTEVEDSVQCRTYFKGSTKFREIKSNIELALLNGCKAILMRNNIPFSGENEEDIIQFVASRHTIGTLLNDIWNYKKSWEFQVRCRNKGYAQQYLNNVACELNSFISYLDTEIRVK